MMKKVQKWLKFKIKKKKKIMSKIFLKQYWLQLTIMSCNGQFK